MNTNIVIGVLVALLVGLGAWLLFGGDKATAPAMTEESESSVNEFSGLEADVASESDEAFAGSGSFLDLMGMGRNLMCDFSYVAEETNGAVAGTVKVSGERIRGDFQMQQAGETYNSHMIQDGTYIHTWSETPQGTFAIRMAVDEADSDTPSGPGDYDRAVDMSSEVDYDCRPWSVDSSVFVPPSNIEFMSMDEMMQNMMQNFDPNAFSQ